MIKETAIKTMTLISQKLTLKKKISKGFKIL